MATDTTFNLDMVDDAEEVVLEEEDAPAQDGIKLARLAHLSDKGREHVEQLAKLGLLVPHPTLADVYTIKPEWLIPSNNSKPGPAVDWAGFAQTLGRQWNKDRLYKYRNSLYRACDTTATKTAAVPARLGRPPRAPRAVPTFVREQSAQTALLQQMLDRMAAMEKRLLDASDGEKRGVKRAAEEPTALTQLLTALQLFQKSSAKDVAAAEAAKRLLTDLVNERVLAAAAAPAGTTTYTQRAWGFEFKTPGSEAEADAMVASIVKGVGADTGALMCSKVLFKAPVSVYLQWQPK